MTYVSRRSGWHWHRFWWRCVVFRLRGRLRGLRPGRVGQGLEGVHQREVGVPAARRWRWTKEGATATQEEVQDYARTASIRVPAERRQLQGGGRDTVRQVSTGMPTA